MSEAQASVLVVDDDREMADVLCDVLREAGYRSIETNTGADALALVKMENPDVFVSTFG
jgi:CheY-like chemotaxis protein